MLGILFLKALCAPPPCSRTCDWMLLIDRCCCPSEAELQGGAVNPLDTCMGGLSVACLAFSLAAAPRIPGFPTGSISYPKVIRAALQASQVSQEHTLSLCESVQLFFLARRSSTKHSFTTAESSCLGISTYSRKGYKKKILLRLFSPQISSSDLFSSNVELLNLSLGLHEMSRFH